MPPRKGLLLQIALFAACALVVLLAMQKRSVQDDYDKLAFAGLQPQVGTWVPATEGRTATGERLMLGQAAHRLQVLYFFDPDCVVCKATAPAVRELSAALARGEAPGVDLYGVTASIDATQPAYARAQGFDFPIAYSTSKIRSLFSVSIVPLTIVVDGDSRVVYAHAGKLDRTEAATLLSAVRLQGGKAAGHIP
jgi:peroxiredoxin